MIEYTRTAGRSASADFASLGLTQQPAIAVEPPRLVQAQELPSDTEWDQVPAAWRAPRTDSSQMQEPASDRSYRVPPISIAFGRGEYPIEPVSLIGDPDFQQDLHAQLAQVDGPVVVYVADLLALPGGARWDVLSLVKAIGQRCQLRLGMDQRVWADPFEAVLTTLVGPGDATHCIIGRRAAIEAAVLFRTDSLETACECIADRLRRLGVRGETKRKLLADAQKLAGEDATPPEITAEMAAMAFQADLKQVAGITPGVPALRFYQNDFYAWQAGHWQRVADDELKARVTRFLQVDGRFSKKLTTRFVGDVMTNLKGMAMLACWNEQMPFLIESEQPLTISRPQLVVFKNGAINLDDALSGKEIPVLADQDPRYFSTVKLPYDYDAAASCPLWLQTLNEILSAASAGDKRIDVLQEFMGWTLIPGDMSFQKFLILVGKGSNGKSTILDAWGALLGSDNVSHVPLDRLNGEFRLCEMMGKLVNLAGDMNHMDQVEEGILKQLTSGDPMQVNRKHKPAVTLRPTARMVFATNTLPSISDRSDGVWRRMIAMPFLVQFGAEKIDPQRVHKLLDELPGIFNWALQGAIRLQQQQRFTACSVCETHSNEHRYNCDPFQQFIGEQCDLVPSARTYKSMLYTAYRAFCEANGRKAKNNVDFGKWVLDLPGVTPGRDSTGPRWTYYQGIMLGRTALDHLLPAAQRQ